jgi:acetyltransferase-like isoleucine patch superfamily enzyme
MVDRNGAVRTCIARNVYIESEVVIGANALIYPGIRLGRGSKVEPGAIVKEPLGDNQIHRAPNGKLDFV